jgi:hypothetical protein
MIDWWMVCHHLVSHVTFITLPIARWHPQKPEFAGSSSIFGVYRDGFFREFWGIEAMKNEYSASTYKPVFYRFEKILTVSCSGQGDRIT